MLLLLRNKKLTRKISIFVCAAFVASYAMIFNFEISDAFAQSTGESKPAAVSNQSSNFGSSTYYGNTLSGYNGLNAVISNNNGYNSNGNYVNYNNSNYNRQFGQPATTATTTTGTGISGFIKNLFGGSSTASTTGTTYGYTTGTTYGYTTTGTTGTLTTTSTGYPTFGSGNVNNLNSNNVTYGYQVNTGQNRIYGKQVAGALGGFLGGIVDTVNYVGGKAVYGGTLALNGLTRASGQIGNGIGISSAGLLGTIGNVLGFGGRVIIGAAKVALTIPVVATKAAMYLTTVSLMGTVRLLGGGLNALKGITGTASTGTQVLNSQLTALNTGLTNSFGTNPQNYNYNVTGSVLPQTFNNQQFGTNLNNSITYANQLQQNMTTNQGIVSNIQLGAQKTMSNIKINAKLAGLSVVGMCEKLAYKTASLVSGAASQTSLALAKSINNIEMTKTNLLMIKQMNNNGIVNPALYQQYIQQSQQNLALNQALYVTTNQTINNSYLSTLSNITGTRNYINQNGNAITTFNNQYYSTNSLTPATGTTYNNYTNLLTGLNNSYSTINTQSYNNGLANTFGNQSSINNGAVTSTNTSLLSRLGLNEGKSERDNAQVVSNSNPLDASGSNAELKAAHENYTNAYNKYVQLLSDSENQSNGQELDKALEDYKQAYSKYEELASKSQK